MDHDLTDQTDHLDEPAYRPLIRSQADLAHLWRVLMHPLGFTETSLWAMVVDADGRPVPTLTEITDLADLPDADEARSLAAYLGDQVDDLAPGGRVALLRSRAGRGRARPDDLAWAAALHVAFATAGVSAHVLHLATDEEVLAVPLDDLPVSA